MKITNWNGLLQLTYSNDELSECVCDVQSIIHHRLASFICLSVEIYRLKLRVQFLKLFCVNQQRTTSRSVCWFFFFVFTTISAHTLTFDLVKYVRQLLEYFNNYHGLMILDNCGWERKRETEKKSPQLVIIFFFCWGSSWRTFSLKFRAFLFFTFMNCFFFFIALIELTFVCKWTLIQCEFIGCN